MYKINSYCLKDDQDRPGYEREEEYPQPQIIPFEPEKQIEKPFTPMGPDDLEKIFREIREKKKQNKRTLNSLLS